MPTSQPNRTVRFNMRETLDLGMIPIVRDNLNGITFNISGSSNGYYGYQPQVASPKCEALPIDNDMEVDTELRTQNRKRIWTCEPGRVDLKKRRQEDPESGPLPTAQLASNVQKAEALRKPTHNVPDLPRCLMSHYI